VKNAVTMEYSREGNRHGFGGGLLADRDVWYFYRSFYSANLSVLRMVVEMRVSNAEFSQPIDKYGCGPREEVLLVDGRGAVIHSRRGEMASLPPGADGASGSPRNVRFGGRTYIPVRVDIGALGCSLMQFIPVENASLGLRSILLFSLIALASAALLSLLTAAVSRRILSNLKVLSDTMDSIFHGNSPIRADIDSNDEIGVLAGSFNEMLERLGRAAETERALLYKQLCIQISPHFLCNALDMVRMSAKLRNQTDLAEAVELIGRYYRNNLRVGAETIMVQEEFTNIHDYIEITNLIRGVPISYQFGVDDELRRTQIPRFIMQPFVENCVKHGFRDRMKNCRVSVRAEKGGDGRMSLSVTDNGRGIPEGTLRDIRGRVLGDDGAGAQIGIVNSTRRLRIYYGEDCGFSVESYLDVGTTVRLSLPVGAGQGEGNGRCRVS
jgi:two-component system, sensor histidine kinase YesM